MKLEVNEVITGVDDSEAINRHEKNMLSIDSPNIWNINIKGNMEIEMEVEFEKFLLSVSEHTKEDLNKITVFKFYAIIEFVKEKKINKKT